MIAVFIMTVIIIIILVIEKFVTIIKHVLVVKFKTIVTLVVVVNLCFMVTIVDVVTLMAVITRWFAFAPVAILGIYTSHKACNHYNLGGNLAHVRIMSVQVLHGLCGIYNWFDSIRICKFCDSRRSVDTSEIKFCR